MRSASSPQDQDIFNILKDLESLKAVYPPELLAARRASFIQQMEQRGQVEIGEKSIADDRDVFQLLQGLKSAEYEYPSKLLKVRRSAFRRQVLQMRRARFWEAIRSALKKGFAYQPQTLRLPSIKTVYASFIIAGMAVAALAGFLFLGSRNQLSNPSPSQSQNGVGQSAFVAATSTPQAQVICKTGYIPPLCLAKKFNHSQDLTFQGNGSARPAVAKDTIPGYGEIHRAAYVNDGLYGAGASWISNSPNSWIKIDLGKATTINTVTFGKDRLGQLNNGDPGQFVIAIALSDNVYADGNSSNDSLEYKTVYDSKQVGFKGTISGPETVLAQFPSLDARFIKITFENAGTAIDEVEVFMADPLILRNPTRTPRQGAVPWNSLTPVPTSTPLPTDTPIPVPTDTSLPTDTATPPPTDIPLPTDTPPPADTLMPLPTDTPVPVDTPIGSSPNNIIDATATQQTP